MTDAKIVAWSMYLTALLTNILPIRSAVASEAKENMVYAQPLTKLVDRQRSIGVDDGRRGPMPRVLKGGALARRAA